MIRPGSHVIPFAELFEVSTTWSVDCVAMWVDNLGFPDLKTIFMTNSVILSNPHQEQHCGAAGGRGREIHNRSHVVYDPTVRVI